MLIVRVVVQVVQLAFGHESQPMDMLALFRHQPKQQRRDLGEISGRAGGVQSGGGKEKVMFAAGDRAEPVRVADGRGRSVVRELRRGLTQQLTCAFQTHLFEVCDVRQVRIRPRARSCPCGCASAGAVSNVSPRDATAKCVPSGHHDNGTTGRVRCSLSGGR